MAIYALSDLHLCLSHPEKSMHMFGSGWEGYIEKIKAHWEETVCPEDTVLVPGDISWALLVNNAYEDFKFLDSLPGTKLICRGNHDYWWSTMKKVNDYFESQGFNSIKLVRTNVTEVEGCLISGTRGWKLPNVDSFSADDRKVLERELIRVGLCVKEFNEADPEHTKKRILMLHYPPLTNVVHKTDFTKIIEEGDIDLCVFGHLHGKSHKRIFEGKLDNGKTIYRCVSGDFISFKPLKIQGF